MQTKEKTERWKEVYKQYEIDYYVNSVRDELKKLSYRSLFEKLDKSYDLYSFFLTFVSTHYFWIDSRLEDIVSELERKHKLNQAEIRSLKNYLYGIAYSQTWYPDFAVEIFNAVKGDLEETLQQRLNGIVIEDDEIRKRFEKELSTETDVFNKLQKFREIDKEISFEIYTKFKKMFNSIQPKDLIPVLELLKNRTYDIKLYADLYGVDYYENIHFVCFYKNTFKIVIFENTPVYEGEGYLEGYGALEVYIYNNLEVFEEVCKDDTVALKLIKLFHYVYNEENQEVLNLLKQYNITLNHIKDKWDLDF